VSRRSGNSFSSKVIKRLLQALIETGPLRKTRLSGKAGINYEMCIKYVSFLMMLNWVEIIKRVDGTEHVSITSEGIEHLRKLQGESSMKGLDIKTNTNNISLQTLKGSSNSSTQTKTVHEHLPKGKQKNIVIIDDDESSLTTYESFLEHYKSNFKIRTFSQPDKALRFLIDHPDSYDLVVLDIRMPKMSGFRLFQGLKAANPNAKVIFMTSLDIGPELLDIFPDIKPNQFIRKPVDRNEFVRIISAASSS
jgi:two-component system catabolic regulation response regulator CreB/two-component system response regulator ChvI